MDGNEDALIVDKIVFNFPHTGCGIKDTERNVRHHQEFMGAFFGWAGAMFGLVEAQRSNRSCRFHLKDFVHRSHLFCTSTDIADLVEQWFATMSN